MTELRKTLVLDAFRVDSQSTIVRKWLSIDVKLSPYFFPETLRCEYDPSMGSLVVYFEYMDEEPIADNPSTVSDDALISVFEGVHTGRPRRMVVQVDQDGIEKVRVQVKNLAMNMPHPPQSADVPREVEASYELAKQALAENEECLEELVTS